MPIVLSRSATIYSVFLLIACLFTGPAHPSTPPLQMASQEAAAQAPVQNEERGPSDRSSLKNPYPRRQGMEAKFRYCLQLAESPPSQLAIACYTRFVQEHPDLPQAYNNLGVLHASRGELVEARHWLEKGLRQQKSYSVLHQNLLNLQSEINRRDHGSSGPWDTAPSPSHRSRLVLLGQMAAMTDPSEKSVKASAEPHPGPHGHKIAPETRPESAPPSAVRQTPRESHAAPGASQPVEEAIKAWASAWSTKDLDTYFRSYSRDFRPDESMDLPTWKAQRRLRITSKKTIQIEISDLKIAVDAPQARATFTQTYEAGAVRATSRKTLDLIQEGDRWRIVQETATPL